MHKQPRMLLITIAIVAALLGAWFAQIIRSTTHPLPTLVAGTLLPAPRPMPAFALLNTHSQPTTQALFVGRWSIVFFGYSSCPDVCPTTLMQLAQVNKTLADLDANTRPQFVFISVDPKHDTSNQLAAYLNFFSPEFVGLTGTQQQIDALTKTLGVPVMYQALDNGAYTIDHAATLFVVDPQARLSAVFTPPYNVSVLAADLRRLVKQ